MSSASIHVERRARKPHLSPSRGPTLIYVGLGCWAHAGTSAEVAGTLIQPADQHAAYVLQTAAGERLELEPHPSLAVLQQSAKPVQFYGERVVKAGVTRFRVKDQIAWWIILMCQGAIVLGAYLGGWRIVKAMGSKITKLQPFGGFCVEAGGGVTILAMSHFGIPVSTTHTITGAIVGAGATRQLSAVRWGVARSVLWAWVLTIPATALVSATADLPIKLLGL